MAKVIFSAELTELSNILQWIRKQLHKIHCADSRKVELAIEEVCVNIMHYGYPTKKGKIQIELKGNSERVDIKIQDWGIPFDPLERAPSVALDASLAERAVGGLGIFFLRKMMDEVTYLRKEDANILTMVKRFSQTK